jgi:hypothetical protein
MSTALDLDLATLVGEMEDVACESRGHDEDSDCHEGPASHYVRLHCPNCDSIQVKAYCLPFVTFIRGFNHGIQCECGHISHAPETATILGPVNGRAS